MGGGKLGGNSDNSTGFSKTRIRHGILRERASVARGRFVSDCGRKCGNH
jgi:hypothetical protein